MTFTIDHGAGGLWEAFQWNGGVELNTQDGPLRLTKLSGLHSLPERTDERAPRVARIGENPYPINPLGKTVTANGEIKVASTALLRQYRTAFLAAFSDTATEGYMDLTPHASVGGPPGRFRATVMQLDIDDEITSASRPYDRLWLLGLRLSDPRIYFPSLAVDVSGNPAVVDNTGSAPVDPVITVAGASGNVTIGDGVRTLAFRNVPSGSLIVDFAARTAKVGATNCELVVASSDWWDRFQPGIAPGTVSVGQTGGTGVRVQFTPATWG